MTCRTCNHYGVRPDADGKVRMRKHGVSPCLSPVAKTAHLLPASITKAYGYREPTERDRKFMQPDDGEGCPVREPRAKP
jgi:hypothetical protein